MSELFAEVEKEPKETGPSEPTMAQAGIETTANIEQESEAALPDEVVLASLRAATEKMEHGVVDEETFEDSTTKPSSQPSMASELEEEVVEDAPRSLKGTAPSARSIISSLIGKSNNTLRYSSPKKGAWRVQPVDSNNPPKADAVLRFLKAAKLSVIKITKGGAPGSASSKFDTYIITAPGTTLKVGFVYGQGRNKGQKFEASVITSMSTAVGGKVDDLSKKVLEGIGINQRDVAAIETASDKRVTRPLGTVLTNVGEMISDMDIVLKNGNRIYVSIKNISGDTFANGGYKGSFATGKVGTKLKIVAAPHRLDDFTVGALGIDKALVAAGITDYANKVPTKNPQINVQVNFNAAKIEQYLASAYGYGYWYVREKGSGVEVVDLTTAAKMLRKRGKVTGVVVTYPFWSKTRATKQLTAKITTTTGSYVVEIRNSQAGLEPNEVKVKTAGSRT